MHRQYQYYILFPGMYAIGLTHTGTHANKFTCAIYCPRKTIVFSLLVLILVLFLFFILIGIHSMQG